MRLVSLVILAILVQSLGNVMLGKGIKQVTAGFDAGLEVWKYLSLLPSVIANPSFLLGVLLLIAFFVLHLAMLSKADSSFVMPVTAFSYVLIAVLAKLILSEAITLFQWIGILLITVGVMVVGMGEARRGRKEQR